MKWTTEKRYQKYNDWSASQLLDLQAQADRSQYQLQWHIRPSSGLLNDPNGFSYFNNEWHGFYQQYPFGAVHGLKSWHHVKSKDLVHWQDQGTALKPDSKFDSHGVYSGSALPIDDRLFLMYTGNVRDHDWKRTSYQNGAWMDKNGNVTKLSRPLFKAPSHVSEHFRDPQLLKHNGRYYALLGAQDEQTKTGKISLFSATELTEKWSDHGYLDFTDKTLGYMIECPNLAFIDQRPVLIFCPQGLDPAINDYHNIYPNTYMIGEDFNFKTAKMTTGHPTPQNLDDGFDVYASQIFNGPDDQVYLISWIGLPDVEYPTDQENWANCLSQVKKLTIEDDQLIQRPVEAIANLRYAGKSLRQKNADRDVIMQHAGGQYELKLSISANSQATLHLAGDITLSQSLNLNFKTGKNAYLELDRTNCGIVFNEKFGTTRKIKLPDHHRLELDIFVDHSVIEIFINNGRHVITARFFTEPQNDQITLSSSSPIDYYGTFWKLASI